MKTKQMKEFQKIEETFNQAIVSRNEWVTDIYKKKGERWLCVLTHLTPVAGQSE
jgi:hypothetical protein